MRVPLCQELVLASLAGTFGACVVGLALLGCCTRRPARDKALGGGRADKDREGGCRARPRPRALDWTGARSAAPWGVGRGSACVQMCVCLRQRSARETWMQRAQRAARSMQWACFCCVQMLLVKPVCGCPPCCAAHAPRLHARLPDIGLLSVVGSHTAADPEAPGRSAASRIAVARECFGVLFDGVTYRVTWSPRSRMSWGAWLVSVATCAAPPPASRLILGGITGFIKAGELYVEAACGRVRLCGPVCGRAGPCASVPARVRSCGPVCVCAGRVCDRECV
jgi:hypothetical protein